MKSDWKELLKDEFDKEYFVNIQKYLKHQTAEIYPKKEDIFRIYDLCSFQNIKVLLIVQDPYHRC
jgi:uracil-DNA glycosylase